MTLMRDVSFFEELWNEKRVLLQRAMRSKQAKPVSVAPPNQEPQNPSQEQPMATARRQNGFLWKIFAALPCAMPHSPRHVRLSEAPKPAVS